MNNVQIVTLTGPSCSGKTTLERSLSERGFASLRSTTTRQPRSGEQDGVDYYFVTDEAFDQMVAADQFVEHIPFNGCQYGVSRAEVERISAEGKPIVIVVEPNGRDQIVKYGERMGWSVWPVYVNSDPRTLAMRFLQRFNSDAATTQNPEKTMSDATNRLAIMMTDERDWVAESKSGGIYCYGIDQYDDTTEASHIDMICRMVDMASLVLVPLQIAVPLPATV